MLALLLMAGALVAAAELMVRFMEYADLGR